jgi:hypothetical protein
MLSRRTMTDPSIGRFQIPVRTVLLCQATSAGIPTLTETTRPTRNISSCNGTTIAVIGLGYSAQNMTEAYAGQCLENEWDAHPITAGLPR